MTDPSPSRLRQLSLKLLTIASGLLIALVILEIFLHFLGPGHLYRTPDDMLATFDYHLGHGLYKPNHQGEMHIPFGDLVAMDRKTQPSIAEPRWVHYHIDAAGFRNDADYAGQQILLVGDSFVACSGSSQEDILSDQLKRDYGINAYNLGFPGELHSYVRYVEGFFKTHPSGPKAYIFLFEGNDFPLPKPGAAAASTKKPSEPSSFEMDRKELQQSFKELLVYRYAFSFYHILQDRLWPPAHSRVLVLTLQGPGHLHIGFLKAYVGATERLSYDAGDDFFLKLSRIKEHLGGIFFIPTKFRVYYNMLEGEPRPPLSNAQWDYVQATASRLGVRCVNLTGPLQEESRRLLPSGKLTFWKDDSHWNRFGIAVAAREVQAFLQQR
jgi:SGNH hydrolase-like domain, acetyltransferase AlgX